MSAVDDLVAALDTDNFSSALDGLMDGADKDGLLKLMGEMESRTGGIPDQDKRHLFKNGIASLKMMADTM